mgnify:CR=1 FL=1
MLNEWNLIIAMVGLWIPITLTLVNIALKFGKLVESVDQMKEQIISDSLMLKDLSTRVVRLEVLTHRSRSGT